MKKQRILVPIKTDAIKLSSLGQCLQ